jgi:hypothetical protein
MSRADALAYEIHHQTKLAKSRAGKIITYVSKWRTLLAVITILINIILLVGFETPDFSTTPRLNDDFPFREILYFLGAAHLLFAILWGFVFFWNNIPVLIYERKKKIMQENKKAMFLANPLGALEAEAKELQATLIQTLKLIIGEPQFIYMALVVGLSALGLKYPAVYAFHLLDIPLRSPQVQNVMKSITLNGTSLLLTV